MMNSLRLRSVLALGASTAALIGAAPSFAQTTAANTNGRAISEVVVTAQRRSEVLQDVPVAVSAFSAQNLKAQRLDGGENLLLAVPNVNYSRSNFGGFNLSIRGIGEKVTSGLGISGVSINENDLPLGSNNFANTDFYDVSQVEVLRGPQGTLYGRNSTGGAVNVITNKPNDKLSSSLTYEYGNYNSNKATGFVNLPIGDTFSLRVAGFYLKHDGYGTNQANGDKIDGRDLGSARFTLAWKPTDNFRAYLMYEGYRESDNRNRVGKQLCATDPGPTSVGTSGALSGYERGVLSQGCLASSLYGGNIYGAPNTQGTTGGIFAGDLGLLNTSAFSPTYQQNHNLHDIYSAVDPKFVSKQNLFTYTMQWDLTNNLTLESITGYNRTSGYTIEDYNRLIADVPYNTTPTPGCLFCVNPAFGGAYPLIYGLLFPGGNVADPQVGTSNRFRVYDETYDDETERTEEIRLSSHFAGKLNFSGGLFFNKTTANTNYFVFFNPLTALAQVLDFGSAAPAYPIDQSGLPTFGGGHNYYRSYSTNHLSTQAVFGEVYYQPFDDVKITLGLRETRTAQRQDGLESPLLVPGAVNLTIPQQRLSGDAPTGRVNIQWTPHFGFTDKSMLYATYSHGYKDGGFNTPAQKADFSFCSTDCGFSLQYQPEKIDAFEVGSKNVLLGGSLILNGDVFYYDYKNYQVATTQRKSSVNVNLDAKIYGAELESIWQPINHLTLNANLGYLHTEISDGSQFDTTNLTQGDPNITHIQDGSGEGCVVNTAALGGYLAALSGLPLYAQSATLLGVPGSATMVGVCGGAGPAALYNYTASPRVLTEAQGNGVLVGQGELVNLKGNKLPNSPEFTVSVGAQYIYDISQDWKATARADYYWQDDSYARIFNAVNDQLKAYDVVNATLSFDNRPLNLNVQVYIKNAFDKQPITDTAVGSASSGLFYNTFTLDPRTYGVSITKRF